MTARRAAALLLVLALAGCASSEHPAADLARWRTGAATIDSLAALDRVEDALVLSRGRVAAAREPRSPEWFLSEARAVDRSLSRRAAMKTQARAALAAADRESRVARVRFDADSNASAAELCRAVWSTRRALLGENDLSTADAGLEFAEAQMALAHAGEADSLARRARAALGRILGDQHPRVADAEELLGQIVKNFTGSRGFDEALGHYRAALRIRTASEGPHSLPVAETLQDLGNLYRLVERPDDAFTQFRQSLAIRRDVLGPVHDRVGSTLGAMAYLRAGQGQWAAAESLARAAIAATPAGPGAPRGGLSTRMALRGQALRHLGRFPEAESTLRAALAVRESLWALGPRDEAGSVVGGLALYRDLALVIAAQGRGDEAFEQLERGSGRTLVGRLLGQSDSTRDAWRGLLSRVQRRLGDDEALIAWPRTAVTMFVADYPMYACVVRSRGQARWIRLDRCTPAYHGLGTIREALLYELLAAAKWPRRVTDTTSTSGLEQLLWRERFAPLEPELAGVRRIVVCSPDFMNGCPLGVLRDDQGRFLADRFAISYTSSARLFASERERPRTTSPLWSQPALLVGDPAYPANDPDRWSRLAGSGEEVRSLASRLPASTLLTGVAARASLLRELATTDALARFRLIHFAAHTAIDPRRVLESALVLAPDTPGSFSSRLTAREIMDHWRLEAGVVSLAACHSIAGMSSSTEGQIGLQQAFLSAGARSLLVTLWAVDDRATARLMDAFYARLTDRTHPLGPALALQEAQRSLREWRAADGTQPFVHAAYWGAFALIGNPD